MMKQIIKCNLFLYCYFVSACELLLLAGVVDGCFAVLIEHKQTASNINHRQKPDKEHKKTIDHKLLWRSSGLLKDELKSDCCHEQHKARKCDRYNSNLICDLIKENAWHMKYWIVEEDHS